MHNLEVVRLQKEIRTRLIQLQVAGCTCLTKTPEVAHHDERCHYRLACEIEDLVSALSKCVDA